VWAQCSKAKAAFSSSNSPSHKYFKGHPLQRTIEWTADVQTPPVELENDLEYEVDFVHDIRKIGHRWMYLVHWKGYADDDDSWEPLSNLSNAKEAIDEFHDSNPQAPKP